MDVFYSDGMQPTGGMPYPPYGVQPAPMVPGWGMPAPPPQPRPRGAPSRSLFLIGAVGSFLAAGAAIPFSFSALLPGFGFGFGFFFGSFFLLTLVSAVLMSVGCILQLIGILGFWKNYGSAIGLAAFIFGLIAIVAFLSLLAFLLLGAFGGFGGFSFTIFILGAIGLVLIGVMFILDGVAYIVNRHFVHPGMSLAAGVLFIIAGGFICSILLGLVGGILAMPAFIIGGIALVGAPIPILYAPSPDYSPVGTRPPMPP